MRKVTRFRTQSNREFVDVAQEAVDKALELLTLAEEHHAVEAVTELFNRFANMNGDTICPECAGEFNEDGE